MTWDMVTGKHSVMLAAADGSAAATEDSSYKYRFMIPSSTAGVVAKAAANARFVEGVCYNRPEASQPVELAFAGIVMVAAGAAVTKGDPVTSDANGRAVTATTGQFVHGTALAAAAAAGDLIPILIGNHGTAA